MVVKVYISGISGNKEVKKRQQRVSMILDSKNIKYEIIDITEPGREEDKEFMQNNAKSNGGTVSDPNPRSPLPPQLFNDEEYCGDYDQFDLANEVDTLEQFLKVEPPPEVIPTDTANAVNGDALTNKENEVSQETNHIVENTNDTTEAPDNSNGTADKENSVNEASVEKESSPVRQKSVEKEETADKQDEMESKEVSEDNTPAQDETVNENGTVSPREQSAEKDQTEQKADNPLEAFIESEKIASTE